MGYKLIYYVNMYDIIVFLGNETAIFGTYATKSDQGPGSCSNKAIPGIISTSSSVRTIPSDCPIGILIPDINIDERFFNLGWESNRAVSGSRLPENYVF